MHKGLARSIKYYTTGRPQFLGVFQTFYHIKTPTLTLKIRNFRK